MPSTVAVDFAVRYRVALHPFDTSFDARPHDEERAIGEDMKISTEVRRYPVAGGIEVEADVGGDPAQPAVILLHGGGQTRHSWGGASRELLRQGFHVINLDARGHGNRGWATAGDYTLEAKAHDQTGRAAYRGK